MNSSFVVFFKELISVTGLEYKKDLSIGELRHLISKINEYYYPTYDGVTTTEVSDTGLIYFSEFHKFWEKYHQEILNPTIDVDKCRDIANILNSIYINNGKSVFYELYNTCSLKPHEISKIRYFSANQDFRGSRDFEDLFEVYTEDPTIFDKEIINEDPEGFLKNIGITKLSQSDKRTKYATVASQILIEKQIEPFDLFAYFDKDLLAIETFLLSKRGSGFGKKKIDMFLRDMVVLNVWKNPKHFDRIDVASDVNTVKVALRTGILKTEIPLVSSLLDIFCYQYGLLDEMNALAWRKVWESWKEQFPKTCIESPSLLDYFVYRIIGKEFCKETLCFFECETGKHKFKWHSSRNKTCQVCRKNKAFVVNKVLPCSDKDGYIVICKNKFVSGENSILLGLKECPFTIVCNSKSENFKKLNPPKSISILGETGWETARTLKGEGGGGLMA
jgi:hypothetical protein